MPAEALTRYLTNNDPALRSNPSARYAITASCTRQGLADINSTFSLEMSSRNPGGTYTPGR